MDPTPGKRIIKGRPFGVGFGSTSEGASDTSRQARGCLHRNSPPLLRGLPLGTSGQVELAVQVPRDQRSVLSRSDNRPPAALARLELCYPKEGWNVDCCSPP